MLISLDTTRADDLSCYGGPGAATPNLDALAGRGVRFATALSQAPTTLSSHASLFFGLDAHGHGVLRNGVQPFAGLPTLAERLQDAGWDTAAVIGASVLQAEAGLSRGFRVYDDDVGDERVRRRYEQAAPEVTARALQAVDGRIPGAPLFLFVHYFDAHMPWTSAPPALQARFLDPAYRGSVEPDADAIRELMVRGRHGALREEDRRQARAYHLAEVAWVDQGLGALFEGLDARGLLQDSLVVAFSDHGESLGEPSSLEVFGHGIDVDPTNLHVPLIVAGKGRFETPAGLVVERQVRLMDLGGTLLSLAGLDATLGQAEDLSLLWKGQAPEARPSFAEANKPSRYAYKTGWNNLSFERSVAAGGYMLVRTPWRKDTRRLFRAAPGWPEVEDASVAEALLAELAAWDAAAPPRRELRALDQRTEAMLKALGYQE